MWMQAKHTPQSLKNVLSIMYSKEDILFAALKVNACPHSTATVRRVDEPILEDNPQAAAAAQVWIILKDRWYQGNDGSNDHYDFIAVPCRVMARKRLCIPRSKL